MKVKYDKEVDVLYITLSDEPISESDEGRPGVIIDYSEKGNIVAIEIIEASKQMPQPSKVEYEAA